MRETDSGIKCLVRQDDGALCTKRMGARTCFIDHRFRQTVLSVLQWRKAQHKRCHRLCTISPVRAIFAVGNCKGFQRVVCVGDSLQQFRIPFFGRAVIVKPSVNHQLVLPWIGGKFPRAHGIAVRQKMTSGLDKSFKTSPMEMLVVIQRSRFQKKLINALILLVEPLAVFVVLYPVFHGKSPCQLLV